MCRESIARAEDEASSKPPSGPERKFSTANPEDMDSDYSVHNLSLIFILT